MHRARTLAIVVAFVALVAPAFAMEPTNVTRARAAYDRGLRLHATGDYAAAAKAFAEADMLVPEAASLEAALEDAMRADDAALVAEMLERSEKRPVDAGLRKTIEGAKKRFAGRAGKIVVECMDCVVAVDGAGAEMLRPIWVKPGAHDVRLQHGDEKHHEVVEVPGGGEVVVRMPGVAAPAPPKPLPPPPPEERKGGISPMWFYMALAGTTVAGTFTTLSVIDTLKKHDRFVADNCLGGSTGPHPSGCPERGREGENAQTRTNILLGATALLAVTTATLGIFVVETGRSSSVGFSATPTYAGTTLQISTP